MTRMLSSPQFLLTAAVFTLLGANCVAGLDRLDSISDHMSLETEETRELNERDDIGDSFAVIDHHVTLIHGHCFDEWLSTDHCSASMSQCWHWDSRGPPAV